MPAKSILPPVLLAVLPLAIACDPVSAEDPPASPALSEPVQSEKEQKEHATGIVRGLVLAFLEDKELEIDEDEFEGEAEAVNPEEELEIELEDMRLEDNKPKATVVLTSPFRFEGELKRDDDEMDVAGEAVLKITMKTAAQVSQIGDQIEIRVRCEELECEVEEVRELEPDLSGARLMIEEILSRYDEDLRETINDWLDENPVDPANPPGS